MPASPWLIALPSARLRRGPVRAVVDGTALAIFRDGALVRALPDRCPHRGVPLSMGSCRGGRLTCRYHGWTFDGEGRLVHVPAEEHPVAPKPLLAPWAAIERDGYVWVAAEATGSPPALGLRPARQWTSRFEVSQAEALMDLAMGLGLPDEGPGAVTRPDGARLVLEGCRLAWHDAQGLKLVGVLVSETATSCRLEVAERGRGFGRAQWLGEAPSPFAPASLSDDPALRSRYAAWREGAEGVPRG